MEKTHEQWDDIANLINKEKEKALEDFRRLRFEPGARPDQKARPVFSPRLVWRPMFTAVAASLFLIVGLILFWTQKGSWHSVSTAPAVERLLADSFLYNMGRDPEMKKSEPRATAFFFLQFAAWGEAAEMNRADAPVVKTVDPYLPTEYGDPAAVQRKMKKVIRENSIERMLTQFYQLGKEV